MTVEGLVTIRSKYAPIETMDRLETAVKSKNLTIFLRMDHAEGAREAGLSLQPTELLIFGNARGGTPLMQSVRTIGIDLPLKVLVWQDSAGITWVSYNDPHWLARRHRLADSVETSVTTMATLLNEVATAAAGVSELRHAPLGPARILI